MAASVLLKSDNPEMVLLFIMNTFQESMYRYLCSDELKTCIIGHSFVRRLITRWKKEEIPLPDFSFDAFGTGGMRLSTLQNIVFSGNFSQYHSVFIQAGENDLLFQPIAETKRAMLKIYEELTRQGVKVVLFGQFFPRHNRRYNKIASLANRMIFKAHEDLVWRHEDKLMTAYSIQIRDGTHLIRSAEYDFSWSIDQAIQSMRARDK